MTDVKRANLFCIIRAQQIDDDADNHDDMLCMALMAIVGHTRLRRCPFLDREETRKRDRELRRRKAEEEEEIQCKSTWVKYSLGLRHQVTTLTACICYHFVTLLRSLCIMYIFVLGLTCLLSWNCSCFCNNGFIPDGCFSLVLRKVFWGRNILGCT